MSWLNHLSEFNELNELDQVSALNELRNELALDRFNISYSELEAIYEDNKDDSETLNRINSCNVVYPERVTELKAIDSEADNQSLE